ncbi:HNH endonuclease [Corynebacterium ulcerans]|uniref:HNH endonuclease n=1 Tax=Corynebacterium ulcerans TaxID=65058 RepID=UPI0018D8D3C7|nr:hypothetical protein [Corynebacterium ulcerans]MBH5303042.1 hypothetical protein [Corynebacterium ulcerans]
MAWSRLGDNIATHPLMARLLTSCDFDHQLKNEAFGALVQLTSASAAHLTDYIVEYGHMAQVAPGREKVIIEVLSSAGLLFRDEEEDGRKVLRIVDDVEFLHNRSKEEVEIDRRRAADKRNPELIPAVRHRDGDQCRWCGRTVNWKDRKSWRAATIDSLNAHKESTVETLVVSCKKCNSKRGAGEELELLPAPEKGKSYYSRHTVDFINSSHWAQENGIQIHTAQTELPIDTSAAPSRQQQESKAAAPVVAAAPTLRAAPDADAPSSDEAEMPDWVREALIDNDTTKAAPGGVEGMAAPSRQQQESKAAAPVVAAAPTLRAAPDADAPTRNHVYNDLVKPTTDQEQITDRQGDGSRSLGTGRDGQRQAGTARKRRRRRGRRGGREEKNG